MRVGVEVLSDDDYVSDDRLTNILMSQGTVQAIGLVVVTNDGSGWTEPGDAPSAWHILTSPTMLVGSIVADPKVFTDPHVADVMRTLVEEFGKRG